MVRWAFFLTFVLVYGLLPQAFAVARPQASKTAANALPKAAPIAVPKTVNEAHLWRSDPLLKAVLKRTLKQVNPLGRPPGDGAQGLNRKFPEKVLVEYQMEGWNLLRLGVAVENGFIIDRGIMAFEWAFGRMGEDGTFGESKTIEVAHFLGLYARALLLLRINGQIERAKRLERLVPRVEISLRSPKSLIGERRWDQTEETSWMTSQRIQAAAAAFWIGRVLANPTLKRTSELWLERSLARQAADGAFPSGFPVGSRASIRAQIDAVDALMGLAWVDPLLQMKMRLPLKRAVNWLLTQLKHVGKGGVSPSATATLGLYAAWAKDPQVATLLKRL